MTTVHLSIADGEGLLPSAALIVQSLRGQVQLLLLCDHTYVHMVAVGDNHDNDH